MAITFKNQQVLRDISWDVKKGERVGLVGVNGAGKTTQLQVRLAAAQWDGGCRLQGSSGMGVWLRCLAAEGWEAVQRPVGSRRQLGPRLFTSAAHAALSPGCPCRMQAVLVAHQTVPLLRHVTCRSSSAR